jgi:hypothetical protein
MPAITFPSSPSNNELFIAQGKAMRYNLSKNKWNQVSTLSSSQITDLEARTIGVSSMSLSGNTLIIQKDDSSYSNVSLAAFSGNILTNYSSASLLPLVDLVSGTQVYVTDTNSLFITDGSGWYKVATVNLSPSLTLGVSSISLGSGGSVDVNYTINEPEDTPYTISASSTSNATITVYQANNTITFDTPVAATTETITITATDGVNSVGDTLTMTISLGTDWSTTTQNTELDGYSGVAGANFGYQVSIAGDFAAVSATGHNSGQGQVKIFKRNASNWNSTGGATLSAPNGSSNHYFGEDLSLTPNISSQSFSNVSPYWLVVGQPNLNSGSGRVSIYRNNGSAWSHFGNIPNNVTGIAGKFGSAVNYDPSGERIFVGAPLDSSNRGKVYVYKGSGNNAGRSFAEEAVLTASDGGSNDLFGSVVKSNEDGSILAVGAWAYDYSATPSRKGAVYIFTRSGTTWTQRAILQASDGAANDYFGTSLDLNETGDILVVGAPNNDTGSTDRGKVYVFTGSGSSWSEITNVQPSDIGNDDQFGFSVAASGDSFVASSRENRATGSGNPTGAAYMFTRAGSTWTQTKKLVAGDIADADRFGWSVDMDGTKIIVGSRDHDSGGQSGTGNAYIFEK